MADKVKHDEGMLTFMSTSRQENSEFGKQL